MKPCIVNSSNCLNKRLFLNAKVVFGDNSRMKARIEPKNILITYLIRSEVLVEIDVAVVNGVASMTASARSSIKVGEQFRATPSSQFGF
ncbi:hypothetical protein Nepgr_013680 [Nepenthes gracilis]|uniref:Uncharacterized protein n=1 Tax=Nepenthes gracilis TaxID=150966 RepID=A0AAD3SJH5_NEPGR|nr:hypothetical protein Nepgr_013680 [Nepenthes gracilis]